MSEFIISRTPRSTLCATLLLFGIIGTLPAQNTGAPAKGTVDSQSLPDSQPELTQLQLDIRRKIADEQPTLAAWKMVIGTFQSAKISLKAAPNPDATAFDRLTVALRSNNVAEAKSQAQSILSAWQTLYFDAQAGTFGNTNQQSDPTVAVFLTSWQTKISGLQSSTNTQSLFQTLYRSDSKVQELQQFLPQLKQMSSLDTFNATKSELDGLLDGVLQQATSQEEKVDKEIADFQAKDAAISAKLGKTKVEINQLAIELGLPLFCGTVLCMLIVPIIVQSFSKAAGSAEQVRAIFSSGILVEIITVLLLTMSILILGLSGKIEGPVLGTLLGGISGYVLNRFRDKNQNGGKALNGGGLAGRGPGVSVPVPLSGIPPSPAAPVASGAPLAVLWGMPRGTDTADHEIGEDSEGTT